jgi:predicted transcriptional regulator
MDKIQRAGHKALANHWNEMNDVIAVSIAPHWVEMILDKRQTFELRRRGPGPKYVGARMLIYATRPLSALVAVCVIKKIKVATSECLWTEVGEKTGCTWPQFQAYFSGRSQGVAIEMTDVRKLEAVPLKRLMDEFNWRPPVSWCRVPDTMLRYPRLTSHARNPGSVKRGCSR